MEETLTLHRLGVTARLRQSLSSTNLIESCFARTAAWTGWVKRWRNVKMVLRRAEHVALVGSVERILAAKRLPVPARQTGANPAAGTTALEREIDARVYRLYGLTPDAIKLVEEISH